MNTLKMVRNSTLLAAGAIALASTSASAQTFDYYTRGYFSGALAATAGCAGTAATAAATASCSGYGYTLAFAGEPDYAGNYGSGTTVNLGTFRLTGYSTGERVVVDPGTFFFTLMVMQTSPVTGVGTLAGQVSGSFTLGTTDQGGLLWAPNEITTVGPVKYDLILNETRSGIDIALSETNASAVKAFVTVSAVPEPSTVVLLGSGLALIGGVVARRRRQTTA